MGVKYILLSVAMLVSLSSCIQSDEERQHWAMQSSIRYIQDNRTGLCFAFTLSETAYRYYVRAFTHVPCEAVQCVLEKQP